MFRAVQFICYNKEKEHVLYFLYKTLKNRTVLPIMNAFKEFYKHFD